MDDAEFEREAAAALNRLPKKFLKLLHNVEIVVEKKPTKRQLREMRLDPDEALYGLYEGTPLSERSVFAPPVLPDRITLYSEPLHRDFPDPDELRRQIHYTVVHEIAHFFGMDEDEIEDLGY
ncbi:MAG TPA: metallopeptidase family protein [Verrucomicrobiae bacterium]|jgi:predicted Zn-dependent protease with MMP-like domain|nr:metallopeptidase family protein [Verrucomicrobiae bacterium]